MTQQANWRFCQGCHVLFFNGYQGGRCSTGNPHVAQGVNFVLPYDVPSGPTAQEGWRFCVQCNAMFFERGGGGVCPAGGNHSGQGINTFALPYNVASGPGAQGDWHRCVRCNAMFFGGFGGGRCPLGDKHSADTNNFVLPYNMDGYLDWQTVPVKTTAEDLLYDGRVVTWGSDTYRATSGLPGRQQPSRQCERDNGPVPEGLYKIQVYDAGQAKDDGTGQCQLAPGWGIQSIPRGVAAGSCEPFWANWGRNRVRLEAADDATKHACSPSRSGFYLHDSTKGFSHGCVEVEGSLFTRLRQEATKGRKSLTVRVKYVGGDTNGGTLVPQSP